MTNLAWAGGFFDLEFLELQPGNGGRYTPEARRRVAEIVQECKDLKRPWLREVGT